MSETRQTYLHNLDYITFCIYLALVGIGAVFIYSVDIQQSGAPEGMADFLFNMKSGKQVLWIIVCLLVFSFIIFFLDHKFWQTFAYLVYGGGLAALVLVLFAGTTIKGATSWFTFGGFSIQPSEFAKFGTCLGMAAYLGHWSTNLDNTKQALKVMGLFLFPAGLVLLQPDAGSALVFMSFLIVMFREGLSPLLYVIGFIGAATFILSILVPPLVMVLALTLLAILVYLFYEKENKRQWFGGMALAAGALGWGFAQGFQLYSIGAAVLGLILMTYRQYANFRTKLIPVVMSGFLLTSGLAVGSNYVFNEVLQPHQQQRIDVWLRPTTAKERNKDSVMNLENSMFAISAGGLDGRGLFEGRMTAGSWVPEQDTDFIFCTVGEEQGFMGTFSVVSLYLLLILRIVMIAERQRTAFHRIYAYGVAGILFVHFIVNIGMTIGLVPIIGIPLPFLSKGGSSLLGFTIMMAVLLKLDKHRGRAKKNTIINF